MSKTKIKLLAFLFIIALAFSFTACNSGKRAVIELDRSGKRAVIELEKIQKVACSCDNLECANKALDSFRTFFKKVKHAGVSKSYAVRAKKAMTKLTLCLIEKGVKASAIMTVMIGK